MNEEKGIMKYESVLPSDFNGVFEFSNYSDEDFVGVWGGEAFTFPSHKRSPMIMTKYSPLEVQHIRKKFAKDLAEREFFKSREYRVLADQEGVPGHRTMNSFTHAAAYNLSDLAPFIQRALEALPNAKAEVSQAPKRELEKELSRNEDGELNTESISTKVSLRKKALEA